MGAADFDFNNGRFHVNGNNRVDDNNGHSRGMTLDSKTHLMKSYNNLYGKLCSYENLESAFKNAKKRKSTKTYVVEFEKNLNENIQLLRTELLFHSYQPEPLKTFIIREPKTRKISKSAFRDRVVHHALHNVIEPIFDGIFIYDSYANRKNKGTLKAIQRFDYFKKKITRNNTRTCYVLKADIKHYFEMVDREILLKIIRRKIKDERIIWLIKSILQNHKILGRGNLGMPLGNLTSQFFANVYLNELDYFVKYKLKAKHYIRYVDDFVILGNDYKILENYKSVINNYLKNELHLELHPGKSKIIKLISGINLLGYRIFYYHKLLRKANKIRFNERFIQNLALCENGTISYEDFTQNLQGWLGYAMWANTFKMRKKFSEFPTETLKKAPIY